MTPSCRRGFRPLPLLLALLLLQGAAVAHTMRAIPLWPEGKTPDFREGQCVPELEWWTPSFPQFDACLIVAPGGGYGGYSYDGEGIPVRDYFLDKGVPVAMLRYRVPRPDGLPKHLAAWQDAQRAVRIVRSMAAEQGIRPGTIGFLGFSAGGHLALMAATSSQTPAYEPIDAIDELPCNIDWAVPVYPAYVLSDGVDGINRDKGNGACELNPEFAFDAATPPMCLLHGDDDVFSAMASVKVYHRLRQMEIPAELHIFAKKGHCFFMRAADGEPAANWRDRVWEWCRFMGFLAAKPSGT
ncbi:MAG: alpha/beta hydrolase [Kiritimatiellia bacterium]|jgi:acetyl esterase/lipase